MLLFYTDPGVVKRYRPEFTRNDDVIRPVMNLNETCAIQVNGSGYMRESGEQGSVPRGRFITGLMKLLSNLS